MFFPDVNEWFEWNSRVISPINQGVFHMGVGANQNRVYTLGTAENWQDNTTSYEFVHQFKMPATGLHTKVMNYCGVIADTASSAQNLGVQFSDDDYQTSTAVFNIDMASVNKVVTRCGAYEERSVRLSYEGANSLRLEKFIARIK